ncbi:winged helix-turn-helix domain-containing protein [Kibdelosporangium lantanae]
MLRIVFTDRDLAAVRMATAPDPLWEITNSLDRLQTSQGRWAFAGWYQDTRAALTAGGFDRTVREMLVPLLPRAAYFPDFLTPAEARAGLDSGLEAILSTPAGRVTTEIRKLARVHGAPSWAPRVADRDTRTELVDALRAYYGLVIKPCEDTVQASVDRDRAVRARAMLDGGTDGLLDSFRPTMRWCPPVLEIDYPVSRTITLGGRGLLLVPSYFCWRYPVALADPDLPPALVYPLLTEHRSGGPAPAPTAALLGATRAAVLRSTATGMSTSEIARVVGISPQTTSHHLNVLRDSNLITSHRQANTVLHVLTPLGAALLTPR